MADSDSPLLGVHSLTKHFGALAALRGVSLDIQAGEFVVLAGPNGAGKSTLLNCISLILQPTSGTIRYRGTDIRAVATEFRRGLGYIAHYLFLYGDLTGQENLRFFARLHGCSPGPAELAHRLDGVGLKAAGDRPVRTYSRGMRQRLAIARALVHRPEFLLLDEPFTGLDPQAANRLTDLLGQLRGEGRTVLMITHDLPRALILGDRLLIMNRGRLCGQVRPGDPDAADLDGLYLHLVARSGGRGR